MSAVNEWYDNNVNVLTLGDALVHNGFSASQLQSYYEKPWRWEREWKALQVSQRLLERILGHDTTTCPECDAQVQPDATACPKCNKEMEVIA